MSFSLYLSEPVFDHLVEAVHLAAGHGARLLVGLTPALSPGGYGHGR